MKKSILILCAALLAMPALSFASDDYECLDLPQNLVRGISSDVTSNGKVTPLQEFLIEYLEDNNRSVAGLQSVGYYGPATQEAVRRLQTLNVSYPGIYINGSVDWATRSLIKKITCGQDAAMPGQANLKVVSPNHALVLEPGQRYNIEWRRYPTSTNPVTVNLIRQSDGQKTKLVDLPSGQVHQSYLWTIPQNQALGQYKVEVRVQTSSDSAAIDESDAAFTISNDDAMACTDITENLAPGVSSDGSNNGLVSPLQRFLIAWGEDVGKSIGTEPVGYYGPVTENDVKKFQRHYNIVVDGAVGWETRAKIKEVSCEAEEEQAKPTITVILPAVAVSPNQPAVILWMTPDASDGTYVFRLVDAYDPKTVVAEVTPFSVLPAAKAALWVPNASLANGGRAYRAEVRRLDGDGNMVSHGYSPIFVVNRAEVSGQ